MKQDFVQHLHDSFVDYAGIKHEFVIVAVSQNLGNTDFAITEYTDYDMTDIAIVTKKVTLGIAFCNPCDAFNLEQGIKVATGRAYKSEDGIYSTQKGYINTGLVTALLNREADFIKNNPGKYIAGYNKAEQRHHEKMRVIEELENLNSHEDFIIDAYLNGVDVDKCTKLAQKMINLKIGEVNN